MRIVFYVILAVIVYAVQMLLLRKSENKIIHAEPVICEILDQFTSIIQYLSEIEEALRDLLVINRGIDNTGVL